MCSACLCMETIVDSCNVVATEHGRYGMFCTYVETACRVHEQCWVCIAC